MDDNPAAGGAATCSKRSGWLAVGVVVWLASTVTGLSALWKYDNTPGRAADAPAAWPTVTNLVRDRSGETLVMFAHPQCTCTQASLDELAEVLARVETRPKSYVVFLKPARFDQGWERTDLWRRASQLPGVTVVRDDNGVEANGFGAATSGQTLLYGADGSLRFSGGITGSRAHAGDNAGRRSLVALLSRERNRAPTTSVFGCPLFQAAAK